MARQRSYSQYPRDAVLLLGEQIRLGRKQRQWSERDLAERAGIARTTLQKIERGEMGCAIGLVFEVAALVDVELFESDSQPLPLQIGRAQDKSVLLPKRIRAASRAVDDDF